MDTDDYDHVADDASGSGNAAAKGVLIKTSININKPRDAFYAIIAELIEKKGLKALIKRGGVRFTIGTMCSGTDAPILALREFQDAAAGMGHFSVFHFEHTFSVEIESFKQGFIERASKPTGEIFRDVVEVSDPDKSQA